jgi:putative tricarboxylic transport membrane protein
LPTRVRKSAPYLIVLAITVWLYFFAGQINFAAQSDRIGPDFWPKAILLLAMAACAYEIFKNLFFTKTGEELSGVLESIIEEAPVETAAATQQAEKNYPRLLLLGMVMTVAYVALIETLGFFLCTFLYLAGFMLVGRYRRIGVVAVTSLAGSLVFMFVFMKIVYVSLPLGQEPFSQVSFLLMRLMGIR